MAEGARVLTNFYAEYSNEMELVCPICGWIGLAKDAESEEYKDLFDVSCPKCSKMLLVVPYPTIQQTKEAATAGNPAAIAALPNVLDHRAAPADALGHMERPSEWQGRQCFTSKEIE